MEFLGCGSGFRKSVRFLCDKAALALGASLVLLFFSLPAFSQNNYGRIFGTVTDQSGAAMVGATVTIADVERGVARPLTTDSAGEYSAPSLIPGKYAVRAEATGFQKLERTDISVGVGQDVRVDLTLQPGSQTQTITVSGEPPDINTTNAQLGGSLETSTLSEIPINGRQFTHLLDYKPGIISRPGAGANSFFANGQRPEADVWMFDGIFDVNLNNGGAPMIGGGSAAAGPDEATILPADAIQEINIVENPKAEYGWKPGAIVDVGLKSGTNNLHGTAFAFGSDNDFDARNAFLTPVQQKAAQQLEQFGGSVGGPIKTDKIFYFASYEGQRYLVGSPKVVSLPTAATGAGSTNSFPDAIAALNTAGVPLSQLSLNLAGCNSAGVCNAASGLFGNAGANQHDPIALNNQGGSNNGIAKVDFHISKDNTLNAEYFIGQGALDYSSTGVQPYWRLYLPVRSQSFTTVDVWTPTSNVVNEARFAINRLNSPINLAECVSGGPNYQAQFGFDSNAPICGFPNLTISGFQALGASSATSGFQINIEDMFEGTDSVSITHGKHLFKFGVEARNLLFTSGLYQNAKGSLNFGGNVGINTATYPTLGTPTALEDFLAGIPASATVLLGNPVRHVAIDAYAGFAQDDWRITQKITVNLGLRYEYTPVIGDRSNQLGNFVAGTPTGLIQEGESALYRPDRDNFAPRLGVAWDVTGKGTTVVRAGAAIVYTSNNFQSFTNSGESQLNAVPTGFALYGVNGSNQPGVGNIAVGNVSLLPGTIPWSVNTPIFGGGTTALACGNGKAPVTPVAGAPATNPSPCTLQVISQNFVQGYVTTWTLGVQHAFTNNLSANVSYVGNHGTHMPGQVDINQPLPQTTNTSATEQSLRPFYGQYPYLGKILLYESGFVSNYNGLQASLTERASHGLSFGAGYTYAHALDDVSTDTQSPVIMDSANPRLDYGTSSFNVGSHFSLTASWRIPGLKVPGQLLEGWEVNSAVSLMSAFPFNASDTANDLSGTGELVDRWSIVGNPTAFKTGLGSTLVPCFGLPTSSFGKTANCSQTLPAACVSAAMSLPQGPGGSSAVTQLDKFGCYMVGNSVMLPPALGTFGDMAKDVLRGAGFHEWEMSVTKLWSFKERYTAQFRAEFFNVLNQVNFTPSGASSTTSLSAPGGFGLAQSVANASNPIIGTGGARVIQFGLKLAF